MDNTKLGKKLEVHYIILKINEFMLFDIHIQIKIIIKN